MNEPWLILETSGRGGSVGLAWDDRVHLVRALDPARRHNRDLAPTLREMLTTASLSPKQISGVMVSIGPGSYTGLRVGIISAKAFAWAVEARLVAVPTFHGIVEGVADQSAVVDVIADALQGLVYAQRFEWNGLQWQPVNELHIEPATKWAETVTERSLVIGPGVAVHRAVIPDTVKQILTDVASPSIDNLFQAGSRLSPLSSTEVLALEPLYLRGSSAEEKTKLQPAGK